MMSNLKCEDTTETAKQKYTLMGFPFCYKTVIIVFLDKIEKRSMSLTQFDFFAGL